MKNIHVLPTDNYAPLVHSTNKYGGYFKSEHYSPMKEMGDSYQHIYITSDEEIKEGDWVFNFEYIYIVQYDSKKHDSKFWYKKIILTTDQDLIKDGVQTIDDEFLGWFVKNSSCEWVEAKLIEEIPSGFTFGMFGNDEPPTELVYKIIIPKEEPKQETLEEAAENYVRNEPDATLKLISKYSFKDGAKWQAERMYSEEEVLELILKSKIETSNLYYEDMKEWFEQIKKK
jgi:hypothetical protein